MNIADKDYEYALKLIKKNKIKRFFEKFKFEDLEILYEIGSIKDVKYMKFYKYYFFKILRLNPIVNFSLPTFTVTYKTTFKSMTHVS
jgi:hypothetical protein